MILRMLGDKPYEYTASEISAVTGLNRTTVYRIFTTLSGGMLSFRMGCQRNSRWGP